MLKRIIRSRIIVIYYLLFNWLGVFFMPIYEYECQQCNHTMEAIQKMSESPLTLCPNCSQNTLIRLVSPAGFQLKGSGWYVTDFRDKNKPKETTSESSDPKGSSDAAEPSTQTADKASTVSSDTKSEKKAKDAASSADAGTAARDSIKDQKRHQSNAKKEGPSC